MKILYLAQTLSSEKKINTKELLSFSTDDSENNDISQHKEVIKYNNDNFFIR